MATKAERPRPCPCDPTRRYAACCKPLHDGRVSPESPQALMRSRYAAFALGLGRYLVDTLARTHADRSRSPVELARELGAAKFTQRFMGLRILAETTEAARGEVLFHARIFVGGRDRSFVELSQFVREEGGWRYESGRMLPASALGDALPSLDRETFVALTDAPAPAGPTGESLP